VCPPQPWREIDASAHTSRYQAVIIRGKGKGTYLTQRCLRESDLWPGAFHNLGSSTWLAWANDTAAHYVATSHPLAVTAGLADLHQCDLNHWFQSRFKSIDFFREKKWV